MKIGVLGGGQLGRMMALAGYPLGLQFRFFGESAGSPASQVAEFHAGDFNDNKAIERFAEGLDLVTYEFENVPLNAARFLSARLPRFFPPPEALEIAQDRYIQKQFFQRLGIPTPLFRAVSAREELEDGIEATGFPAVLKTRRWGYDGKGQAALREPADLDSAWNSMGGSPLILEGFVKFEREISLIAARSQTQETAFYPLTENRHRDGILRVSLAPAAGIEPRVQALAEEYAQSIFRELHYAGVLTIEFFYAGGKLLANEMATRVHNSGHWTIEGADTSQFENHLRAITGLPLGSTSARGISAMVNFVGCVPDTRLILSTPGAHLHLYGKAPRTGRKLGHATICSRDPEALQKGLETLQLLAGC
ncbi:MAG: 5-(carboxyamino)imidazole ribonucleotide synthase [Terriglobia bacterium]